MLSAGPDLDYPVTATAWIDLSGASTTPCAGLPDTPACHPSPGDPQGTLKTIIRANQVTTFTVAVVDPQ